MKSTNGVRYVIVAFAAVIVLLFGVTFMTENLRSHGGGNIRLPEMTDASAVSDSAENTKVTEQSLKKVEVTPENVREILGTLSRPKAYTLLATTEISADSRTLVTEVRHCVMGDRSATVRTVGQQESHILRVGGVEYCWEDSGVTERLVDFGEDAATGLPAYEAIYDAALSDISDTDYELCEGFSCICFSLRDDELGLISRYCVDIDTGLLVRSETVSDSGQTLYRMQVFSIVLDTPDDGEFLLSDGSMPG